MFSKKWKDVQSGNALIEPLSGFFVEDYQDSSGMLFIIKKMSMQSK